MDSLYFLDEALTSLSEGEIGAPFIGLVIFG